MLENFVNNRKDRKIIFQQSTPLLRYIYTKVYETIRVSSWDTEKFICARLLLNATRSYLSLIFFSFMFLPLNKTYACFYYLKPTVSYRVNCEFVAPKLLNYFQPLIFTERNLFSASYCNVFIHPWNMVNLRSFK